MDYVEEQHQEYEALKSIYMDDFIGLSTNPLSCMVRTTGFQYQSLSSLCLKFTLPPTYPDEAPVVEIPLRQSNGELKWKDGLLNHLKSVANSLIGEPAIYSLVEATKEWLDENYVEESIDEPDDSNAVETVPTVVSDGLETKMSSQGKWDYVIGLVGKPSSGKSTFFNAATKRNQAAVASHPFTTIEANYGQAFYSITDPSSKWSVTSQPAYGRPSGSERYIPLLLKDVAGLVPGAADGRGRGNRFLNDLCDADVLIHIVDASGKTNEYGEEVESHDPAHDVRWLQDEIHNWIYNNIMLKWDSIIKRPIKLLTMFTGYHATNDVIQLAFAQAGINVKNLNEDLPGWNAAVLHKLVDSFIKLRFPILLVFNKSDDEKSSSNIVRMRETFPSDVSIAVSAKSECYLQQLASKSLINYDQNKMIMLKKSTNQERENLRVMQESVIDRYGGTNVLQALNAAVSLRQPTYAYPVRDLVTLLSHEGTRKGEKASVLRDCVSLKPGTTINTLYEILLYHYHLISGKFVRAEALCDDFTSRIVRKDDVIDESNCVIKIMTTKKS